MLWKFGFQDRMDRGDRVSKMLSYIGKQQQWNQECIKFKLFNIYLFIF